MYVWLLKQQPYILSQSFQHSTNSACQKPIVLITAGPTREAIDPVRYITNHSSGKMGYAIAESFLKKGFTVVLVSSHVTLNLNHPDLTNIAVNSADVMFDNWDELCEGRNFSIVELNGAGSEPTHIYDSRHSIFFAWREIIRRWKLLYRISRLNHEIQGLAYMTYHQGREMLKNNTAYEKLVS